MLTNISYLNKKSKKRDMSRKNGNLASANELFRNFA